MKREYIPLAIDALRAYFKIPANEEISMKHMGFLIGLTICYHPDDIKLAQAGTIKRISVLEKTPSSCKTKVARERNKKLEFWFVCTCSDFYLSIDGSKPGLAVSILVTT